MLSLKNITLNKTVAVNMAILTPLCRISRVTKKREKKKIYLENFPNCNTERTLYFEFLRSTIVILSHIQTLLSNVNCVRLPV